MIPPHGRAWLQRRNWPWLRWVVGDDAWQGGEGPSSPTLILISSAELKSLEAESTDSCCPGRDHARPTAHLSSK